MPSESSVKIALYNESFKKPNDVASNRKHQNVNSAQIKRSNTIVSASKKAIIRSNSATISNNASKYENTDKKQFLERNESYSSERIRSSSSAKIQKTLKNGKTPQEKPIKLSLERATISRSSEHSNSSINTNTSKQIKSSSSNFYTLENLINEIVGKKFKKILVLTGAGISTPSGIPDFRTPNTGIYDNLAKFNVPYPEAIFEKEYFRRNPKPFFKIAKELLPNKKQYKPNKIHYFIRLLQEKRILHRLYTQNIDSLEILAGIKPEKLIEAHGSFRSAKCVKCTNAYPIEYVDDAIEDERIPICNICFGIVKPDIIFFGEDLPEQFYKMYKKDFALADLVIVLGTSLKVEPFASIIDECPKTVPRVLMNKNLVGPFKKTKNATSKKDVAMLGDLVDLIQMFVQNIGWEEELNELMRRELDLLAKKIKIEEELAEKIKNQKETDKIDLKKESEKVKLTTKSADKSKTKIEKPANTILYNKLPIALKLASQDSTQLPKCSNKTNLEIISKSNGPENDYFKNILQNYETIRKGNSNYNLSYGVKKIDLDGNYNLFSDYKSKIDLITHKPPLAQPVSINSDKTVNIYVVNTATPIKFNNSYCGSLETKKAQSTGTIINPITNIEKFDKYCSNTIYRPPPTHLFEEPTSRTSTLNNNLNNKTFYTANSKPMMKQNQDIPVLQMAKLNVENLDIMDVERKNNELILQMRRNCKC